MNQCVVCLSNNYKTIRTITSHLEEIPEGLDRLNDVQGRIEKCQNCGLLRTIHLSEERSDSELYQKDSVCFEASMQKFKVAEAGPTLSIDEISLLSIPQPARLLDVGFRFQHLGH